jgi:hypothetical protein
VEYPDTGKQITHCAAVPINKTMDHNTIQNKFVITITVPYSIRPEETIASTYNWAIVAYKSRQRANPMHWSPNISLRYPESLTVDKGLAIWIARVRSGVEEFTYHSINLCICELGEAVMKAEIIEVVLQCFAINLE